MCQGQKVSVSALMHKKMCKLCFVSSESWMLCIFHTRQVSTCPRFEMEVQGTRVPNKCTCEEIVTCVRFELFYASNWGQCPGQGMLCMKERVL